MTTSSGTPLSITSTSSPFARRAIVAGKRVEHWAPTLSHPERLDQPLRWRRPRMVFVNSMSDLFHELVPDEFIARVFNVMAGATRHAFQVLTKRPERAAAFLPAFYERVYHESTYRPLPNVWLGVSIENARYTWRADVLREIPAAVRFISAEPLLGSLFDVGRGRGSHEDVLPGSHPGGAPTSGPASPSAERKPLDLTGIDWVIVGGESGGRHARPMHPEWARELRDACLSGQCSHGGEEPCDDCVAERPAFFFKQWGSYEPVIERKPLDLTGIDWVIVGGESGGRHARPMHPEWARELRDACLCARTESWRELPNGDEERWDARPAFFFKQWGSWASDDFGRDPNAVWVSPDGRSRTSFAADVYDDIPNGSMRMRYAGASAKSGGRLLDGREWNEMPPMVERREAA